MQRDGRTGHSRIEASDLTQLALLPLRGLGLSLTVVGAILLWPALLHFAGLVLAGPSVQADIVERYFDMEPRLAGLPAEERIARDSGVSVDWMYYVTGHAVLEYRDRDGNTQRRLFRGSSHVHDFHGQLERLVPLTMLEARFPPGELDLLRRIPAAPARSGDPPRPWVRSAYDQMLLEVDDPVEFLVRSWTSVRGETVGLDTTTVPGGQPTLHSVGRAGHALMALPMLLLGMMLTLVGLGLALFGIRAPRGGETESLRPARWWIVVVLSSPIWAQTFPSALNFFGATWASEVLELTRDAPHDPLGLFNVPVGEMPEERPYEALRFPSEESVYAPLWDRLALVRPPGCCADRASVLTAATGQVRSRLDAMDAEAFAAFTADVEALHRAGHWNLDGILVAAMEARRLELHRDADPEARHTDPAPTAGQERAPGSGGSSGD